VIIRFAGFGGQGIVLASYIMGQSAAFDGKKALQNQSYGSESRGGECRGDVIISDDKIYDLEPTQNDVLVAMTQPAYEKFYPHLTPGGTLIYDKDLVSIGSSKEPRRIKKYGLSATDIAFKKLGRKIFANMVMLGFMNTLMELVSEEALEKAIANNVPKGTEDMNLAAMREGIKLAEQEKKPSKFKKRAAGK
jgi:2-oxoglutarate ferredoxin oxidoreductase subunit gamma